MKIILPSALALMFVFLNGPMASTFVPGDCKYNTAPEYLQTQTANSTVVAIC